MHCQLSTVHCQFLIRVLFYLCSTKNTFRLFFIGFRLLNRKLISCSIRVRSYSIVVSRGCISCRITYLFQQFAKSVFRILCRVGSSVKHFPYAIDFGHTQIQFVQHFHIVLYQGSTFTFDFATTELCCYL